MAMAALESRETMRIRTILRTLDVRNRVTCGESNPSLDRLIEEQYETSTEFAARPGKTILILALEETYHSSPLLRYRGQFEEIHIILGRAITEPRSHERLLEALRWLKTVTTDGELPVMTLELVGIIHACGCRFGELTRYTQHLVVGKGSGERHKWLRVNANKG